MWYRHVHCRRQRRLKAFVYIDHVMNASRVRITRMLDRKQ